MIKKTKTSKNRMKTKTMKINMIIQTMRTMTKKKEAKENLKPLMNFWII